MTSSLTWLVPVGAAAADRADTESILDSHRIDHQVLDRPWIVRDAPEVWPSVAIIQGGVMKPVVVEFLRWLTSVKVPTLVLLEQLNDHQEALLLGGGAFDVVGLPTSPERLSSRIVAMHRNATTRVSTTGPPSGERIVVGGGLEIRPAQREVRVGPSGVELTKTEFDLLLALARQPRRVLSREELGVALFGKAIGPRALESHLSRLRLKVVQAGGPRLIHAVRGVGYRLMSTSVPSPELPPAPVVPISHPAGGVRRSH